MELAARLASPETRAPAASALAEAFGAETLLIFIRDHEVGALLSAPGFPQTLPNGKLWRTFLAECAEHGRHTGMLPLRSADELLPSVGFAVGPDVVLILLGTQTPVADVGWLLALLPLLAAVFRGEQQAAVVTSEQRLARESAARATALARTLDRTRLQLENALLAAREARAELERAHGRLKDHAVKLELTNDQLREQANALEAQALELETRADELHAANTALQDARTAADTASRAKSDFLTTMSHELRTPLNAIGGHVQLIEMGVHGPVTDQQRQALARIDRSQRHLVGLITDILNLSRIEAGGVEYVMSDVSLLEALTDLAPMIEPQLAARKLTYEIRDADHLPIVRADREKLQQILLNLLSNSAKFTDPGGRVWIEAGKCPEPSGRVFVRVMDTGRGIPSDKLALIFEPFTQVDASHSRTGQGIGLGLAISRDLARGMNGDLRVESALGAGSAFTLTLDGTVPGTSE